MIDVERYRPVGAWFAHNPRGIHGIGHAGRVFVWANLIGGQLRAADGGKTDVEVVRWAAVLHDVGRVSDGTDRGHGARSAQWIKKNRNRLPMEMDDGELEKLLYCCTMHDTPDKEIGELTEELRCLKDADGLDRVRINGLDPNFLRTPYARPLVEAAWDLFRATHSAAEAWEAVRECAEGRGWLRGEARREGDG
jgi:hypothetical protein